MLVDVVVQPDRLDARDVSRPRAKSQPIQDVQDPLVIVKGLSLRGLLLGSPTGHEAANNQRRGCENRDRTDHDSMATRNRTI